MGAYLFKVDVVFGMVNLVIRRDSIGILSCSTLIFASHGHEAQLVACLATDVCLDCRSRGREFDPGPIPYFLGD